MSTTDWAAQASKCKILRAVRVTIHLMMAPLAWPRPTLTPQSTISTLTTTIDRSRQAQDKLPLIVRLASSKLFAELSLEVRVAPRSAKIPLLLRKAKQMVSVPRPPT